MSTLVSVAASWSWLEDANLWQALAGCMAGDPDAWSHLRDGYVIQFFFAGITLCAQWIGNCCMLRISAVAGPKRIGLLVVAALAALICVTGLFHAATVYRAPDWAQARAERARERMSEDALIVENAQAIRSAEAGLRSIPATLPTARIKALQAPFAAAIADARQEIVGARARIAARPTLRAERPLDLGDLIAALVALAIVASEGLLYWIMPGAGAAALRERCPSAPEGPRGAPGGDPRSMPSLGLATALGAALTVAGMAPPPSSPIPQDETHRDDDTRRDDGMPSRDADVPTAKVTSSHHPQARVQRVSRDTASRRTVSPRDTAKNFRDTGEEHDDEVASRDSVAPSPRMSRDIDPAPLRDTIPWSGDADDPRDARSLARARRVALALSLRGAMRVDEIAARCGAHRSTIYRDFQDGDRAAQA